MHRYLAALALGAFVVGIAHADIPPPKGFKRITVEHKITTEKDYPEFQFFTVLGDQATVVKLDAKTPATFPGGRPPRGISFVAVPKDAAKAFDSEKELLAAVAKGKIEGQLKAKTFFGSFLQVKDTDTRKMIVQEYKLTKVDAKEGIVLEVVAAAKDPETPPKKENSSENEAEELSAAPAARGGVLIAGLSAFLGLTFAGLWLARRRTV